MNANLRTIVACAALIVIGWVAFSRFSSGTPAARQPIGSSDATPAPDGYATPVACDDAGFRNVAATHPRGYTEVTVCGNVTRVLPERTTRSGAHAYFYVAVDTTGDTIEIVTNVDETGNFVVKPGDTAVAHGRYYDDSDGTEGIDWTHHNDGRSSWPYPGYVQINGGPLIQ